MADWKDSIIKTWAAEIPETRKISILNTLLSLLSLLYRAIVAVRNVCYDKGILKQRHLSCKVVSIGNITAGGTGKTPMTITLATLLKDAGFRPAILSRGYGGKNTSDINIVSDGQRCLMNPDESGDEPFLMARSCPGIPVITGPERHLTGAFAIKHFNADVLVLDDGFQHRRLFRDIDIVLVDVERPFGNGFMLPRGPLREPKTAIRRADIIVKTGVKVVPSTINEGEEYFRPLQNTLEVFNGQREPKEFIRGTNGRSYPLTHLKGKRVCAFAGIAVPDSFKSTLEQIGVHTAIWIPFPDHHGYTQKDIADIKRLSREAGVDDIVATEKDGVKLSNFPDFLADIYLLKIEMTIQPSVNELKLAIMDKLKNNRE